MRSPTPSLKRVESKTICRNCKQHLNQEGIRRRGNFEGYLTQKQ